MQIVFIIISVIGLLYFLFAKRRFDLFSIAFFSTCIYFLPGFFGYVLYPIEDGFIKVELIPETYFVMVVVQSMLLISGMVFDIMARKYSPKVMLSGGKYTAEVSIAVALVGFAMAILTTGSAFLFVDKIEMMANLNRWYILSVGSASLGAVLSFNRKRWGLFLISMVIILCDVFIGFRFVFVMTFIAIFTLKITENSKSQRFAIENWKICLLGLITAFFVFVYKNLFESVKSGDIVVIIDLLSNPEFYISSISYSEPFVTQAILNEVLNQNFAVGIDHFGSVIYQFILFAPDFVSNIVGFNDLFQPALFPAAFPMGMANNIWAEMLSSGGWLLFVIFLIFFIFTLMLGSYILRTKDPEIKVGAALFFSYWAFYINRNDLLNQVGFQKRILLLWTAFFAGSILLSKVGKSINKVQDDEENQS